jgi:hypothetical protein
MGVSRAQQLYSGGLPFEIQGKQVQPAPEQSRPDRTARPGFFLPEFRSDFDLKRTRFWRNKLTRFSAVC